ncbi:MAG TPA: Mur ligase family protein [Candidatus Saccharimonadales bacterium]|nr:Mur ligase family protein [Candidatus Saccharimonadales bacterium]
MISAIIGLYSWRYPSNVIYMLQSCEYQVLPYLRWYWRTTNFSSVAHRRSLQPTRPARLLLLAMRLGMLAEIAWGLLLLWRWWQDGAAGDGAFGLAAIFATPVVWAQLIVLPLLFGRWLIIYPKNYILVRRSQQIFQAHKGIKIAVAGSYGKTTMKELLATVLGTSKTIAVTPGNKNVSVSHAYFAQRLKGDEDIVIIEYGEGAPGDVARFAATTHPTHAVITGIAPAHLDRYKTVEAAAKDIFSLSRFVKPNHVYVNEESSLARSYLHKRFERYSQHGALGWSVDYIRNDISGISFQLKKNGVVMQLHSGLLGRHQIGPIALSAALAYHFGVTTADIEDAVAQTKPFEHRMQPYLLQGAWIIDDTYNGNIEGVRVGTELLKELPAKRKIYVTPGLVDQGAGTKEVHETMGRYIAAAKPDITVLMKNSVTGFIRSGLDAAGYTGQVTIEDDPLSFYTNLSLFVAAGDLVLMQNDWPDNYA